MVITEIGFIQYPQPTNTALQLLIISDNTGCEQLVTDAILTSGNLLDLLTYKLTNHHLVDIPTDIYLCNDNYAKRQTLKIREIWYRKVL